MEHLSCVFTDIVKKIDHSSCISPLTDGFSPFYPTYQLGISYSSSSSELRLGGYDLSRVGKNATWRYVPLAGQEGTDDEVSEGSAPYASRSKEVDARPTGLCLFFVCVCYA